MSGRSPTGTFIDGWTMARGPSDRDAVQLGNVVVEDATPCVLVEMHGVLGEELLAVRPRRIAVREVVRPHQPVGVHEVRGAERDPVVLEREGDVAREPLA